MHTHALLLMALILSVASTAAHAQSRGSADIGLRFTDVDGDEARYQRFRDLSDGALLDRFRFEHEGERWLLSLSADHAGRRDQRYALDYLNNGRLKVSFVWDQVPQFISRDTRTLFTTEAPGVFRLDDAIQQALQASPGQLANFAPGASPFDMRARRDVAAFAMTYTATRDVDVTFNLTSTRRDGTMPWAVTFGHSNLVELPAPIDTRTTDVTTGVEWASRRGSFRVGYDGSLFTNHVPALVWDNPWRLLDAPNASSQGRAALPPTNSLHAITTTGGLALPARSRLSGSVTVGTWRQNDSLVPFTINSALSAPALPRQTAEAEARTLAMTYSFTSRPARLVWLNARYRFYDFDHRTPDFEITSRARNDSAILAGAHGPQTLSSTRHNVDLDLSLTPMRFSAFRVGYRREQVDRTHRIFGRTAENVFRASADTTVAGVVTLRGIVERADRAGSRFDEEALLALGEQPAMRHFDIADRDRTRATALVQITPLPEVGISVSVARGKDDYTNSGFGLRDSQTTSYSVALDVLPGERVNAGVSFVSDSYAALQRSRAASAAQFNDPTRDWLMDTTDRTQTLTAGVDLIRVVPATDLRLAYDFSRSRASYLYLLPPGSTLASPSQFPPVISRLQSATLDVRHSLSSRVAIGGMYWFGDYHVEDFSLGPETMTPINIGNNLFLGYLYRPYRAHAASARLMFLW